MIAKVDIPDGMGRTAIFYAVIDRKHELVAKLLRDGADPNPVDKAGWSLLHFAAQENYREMVRLLIDHGADLNRRDQHGNTPLIRAVMAYRGKEDCIQILLDAGADPDVANLHGVTPRSLAQSIANYPTARFFD